MTALEQAVFQAVIECLAERVAERLRAAETRALVLMTGTTLGLTEAAAALHALTGRGWSLKLVLSAGARILLSADHLRLLPLTPLDDGADTETLLDGCRLVVAPTLTVTTAAKLAGGVRDSRAAHLLARALEKGIGVVAASDGCCPDNPERARRGFAAPDAYKARLRANLAALKSYGVTLVPARRLADALGPGAAAAPALPAARGRVFSRADVLGVSGRQVRLAPGVLVTPLAAEEMRIRNIELVQA